MWIIHRLVYILISEKLIYDLRKVYVTQPVNNRNMQDHMALKATFNYNIKQKGPSYWKLSNNVLRTIAASFGAQL